MLFSLFYCKLKTMKLSEHVVVITPYNWEITIFTIFKKMLQFKKNQKRLPKTLNPFIFLKYAA